MKDKKIWFAVMMDKEDLDWGTGSHDLAEAMRKTKEMENEEAFIFVVDMDGDPVAIDTIEQEDFDDIEDIDLFVKRYN